MSTNTDWIEWAGGECPVPEGSKIIVRWRDGGVSGEVRSYSHPKALSWSHDYPTDHDIIAYRIVKP